MYKVIKNTLFLILLPLVCFLPSTQSIFLKNGTESAKFILLIVGVYALLVLYLSSLLVKKNEFKINRIDILLLLISLSFNIERESPTEND